MTDVSSDAPFWRAYKINRGNSIFSSVHSKSLTLDGSNYAYHADTDVLDVGLEDFMICGWVKLDVLGTYKGICCKISDGTGAGKQGYSFHVDTSNKLRMILNDASTRIFPDDDTTLLNETNKWYFVCAVIDRAGNVYYFNAADFSESEAITSVTGTLSNSQIFGAGLYVSDVLDNYLMDGNIDELRIYRFGVDGLYVTGTFGSSGIIRVGSASGDLIWSDTDDENLIKRLYYSPYSSLTNLGYSSIDDADRTERATNGTFDANVDDWDAGAGGVLTWDSTDIDGNTAHAKVAAGPANAYPRGVLASYLSNTATEFWEVSADVYLPSGQSAGTVRLGIIDNNGAYQGYVDTTTTDSWVSLSKIIQTDGAQTSISPFVQARNCDPDDIIYFDNVSMKRLGEVARYKFNSDLTDESSNGLDLTGVNTPTYSDNTYINPLMYNSINPHTGTISFWITPDWDGDDGEVHYVFIEFYSVSNYIAIRKYSSNNFDFIINSNGTLFSASISASSWNKGELHHIACTWSVHTIDGTDYMHLYIDGSEVANETDAIGIPQGVEEYSDFKHFAQANEANAVIEQFQISHIPWKDTISNAEAVGMSETMSVEWHYNSGVKRLNSVCNEYTGCLIVED